MGSGALLRHIWLELIHPAGIIITNGGWQALQLIAIMNHSPLRRLSGTYLSALRTHFEQGPQVGLQTARGIGREAVRGGLETLDLAKIHHRALAQLLGPGAASGSREDLTARAAAFFTEVITPIEETHRDARQANAELHQLHATLDERMVRLAAANRELQQQVAERAAVASALKASQRCSGELLKDSRVLEKQLQVMAHKILSATETERKKLSLQLNDEVAQILLGINIRILALKKVVASNHADLAGEIAAAQRLIEDSANIIRRLAHEFSNPHQR
jgi:two-component system sensor histidine kinase DegS